MKRNGHYLITTISITGIYLISENLKTDLTNDFINNFFIYSILIFLGSLIPDLDFKLFGWLPQFDPKRYWEYHRQITHSFILWASLLVFGYFNNIFVFWFSIGVFTHLIADIITGNIPFLSFWNKGYNDNFPKRIGFKLFGSNANKILIDMIENFSKKGGLILSFLVLIYIVK